MIENNSDGVSLSFIVPVFNRPNEVRELLESFSNQSDNDFEVIIVEDGSTIKCEEISQEFENKLNLNYFYKDNSGPGQSRNYGFTKAKGNYGIFLDSDCVLPENYVKSLRHELNSNFSDAFGGPDKAHENFTQLQKAINYSMTSFFTTGGIRGSSEKLEKFHPRSFNMGYSKEVFEKTGGFSKLRFGEDIDMSIRINQKGFTSRLIKDAYVYHKRRTSYKQFFKQIYNSGIARINLYKRHPKSLKIVHTAPAVFTLGTIGLVLGSAFYSSSLLIFNLLHMTLLFFDSSIKNKSLKIGANSVLTSYIQLFAYGSGFLNAVWKRIILNQEEYAAYTNTFYD